MGGRGSAQRRPVAKVIQEVEGVDRVRQDVGRQFHGGVVEHPPDLGHVDHAIGRLAPHHGLDLDLHHEIPLLKLDCSSVSPPAGATGSKLSVIPIVNCGWTRSSLLSALSMSAALSPPAYGIPEPIIAALALKNAALPI